MISKGNESLCGLSRIPAVVMEGSHSSTVHLDSDIHNGDHVTYYSPTHQDISYKGEVDLNDKRQIKLSPWEFASCYFPLLNKKDACVRIHSHLAVTFLFKHKTFISEQCPLWNKIKCPFHIS